MVRRGLDAEKVEIVKPVSQLADAALNLFAGPAAVIRRGLRWSCGSLHDRWLFRAARWRRGRSVQLAPGCAGRPGRGNPAAGLPARVPARRQPRTGPWGALPAA